MKIKEGRKVNKKIRGYRKKKNGGKNPRGIYAKGEL